MIDLKRHLNSSQFSAVTTINGPVLVIAGAGSGKTRVIEYRVLNLIYNNITPNLILLLTFTRKAAREMLSRAANHDSRCGTVEGGTFHSFGYKILKKHAKIIGFPNSFSILDEGDAEEAIHRCCNKIGFLKKEKRFPKKDTLKNIISMSINKNITIGEVLEKEYPHFLEYASDIESLRQEYTEYKINKNYLDYDDLLIYLRVLLEDKRIRDRISQKYQFIMVDEYQDTNTIQGDITYLLAKKHRNVMVVGDDAQSIYGFRGATHENIMRFTEKFPDCKIIKLEENYRSTQSILDVANSILENMKNKYSKCLVSARKRTGVKPQLLMFKDSFEEAGWIAGKIKDLRDEGIMFNHQGVLFRSSYISIPLQAELSKRNIPYQVFGGRKFYETAHVKDVMAHLKVIINSQDELSWNRILMLIAGIGHVTCEQILKKIAGQLDLSDLITKVIHPYAKDGTRYAKGIKKLEIFLKSISVENLNVGERFEIVLKYYNPILKDKFDDWNLRLNDLETLRQIATRYNSLEDLLSDFAIESPERGIRRVEHSLHEDEKPLILSTIHSAKGLEWEAVFVISLMDGVLPVSFALNDGESIEEEHRLFYVAVTRAKNDLFLSLNHEGTGKGVFQFNKISRFIDMPNVLSKLETKSFCKTEAKTTLHKEEDKEKLEPIYNKKSLLKKVVDFFR